MSCVILVKGVAEEAPVNTVPACRADQRPWAGRRTPAIVESGCFAFTRCLRWGIPADESRLHLT
jgi:hypothetical protein